MTISMIAAVAANGVIGANNTIPWRLPEDLRHFKETTKDGVVIMGRKTWESLPKKPLPNRHNIVVCDDNKGPLTGGYYARSPSVRGASTFASQHLNKRTYLIGGAAIYAEGMTFADELIITHLPSAYEGDVFFPLIDQSIWHVTSTTRLVGEVVIKTYRRR